MSLNSHLWEVANTVTGAKPRHVWFLRRHPVDPRAAREYCCNARGVLRTWPDIEQAKAKRDELNASILVAMDPLRLARAVQLALEVIRRHDAGMVFTAVRLLDNGDATHKPEPLDCYCGQDNLVDSDGVQGIGDVLREALQVAGVKPIA